jgi:glycosyltransferase involved in cell wall biosynthesis
MKVRKDFAMRRVLLTAHKFFPEHRAGTEVLTLKIAQELQRRGFEVKVVAANPPDLDARRKSSGDQDNSKVCSKLSSDFEFEGVPVHIIEEALRLKDFQFSFEYYHPHIKAHFAEILKEFKPDIVQLVHAQNLSASVIEACREYSAPVVFYSTDFWFVCPIVQLKRPDGAVCRGPGPMALKCLDCYTPKLLPPDQEIVEAIAGKYPSVGTAIDGLGGLVKGVATSLLSNLYRVAKAPAAIQATLARPELLKNSANSLAKILVPTRLMRDIFIENGIDNRLIKHVPFGIDTSKLNEHQTKKPSEKVRIGYIGTFFEHKGVDLLIRAFLALPEKLAVRAQLKLYGDTNQFPEYVSSLKKIVEDSPKLVQNVSFLGTFPNDQLGSVLEEIDVLVVPSRWYENTPLVMQSALATLTPLIVTDLGGMSELVKHGGNGLLFKLNDYRSLLQQLTAVLEDRALLPKLASNIKPERTVSQMVDDIESVYEELLTVRPS